MNPSCRTGYAPTAGNIRAAKWSKSNRSSRKANMLTIAVDAMGGDDAPKAEVEGAIRAARSLAVKVILVGQQDVVRRELEQHPLFLGLSTTVHVDVRDQSGSALSQQPAWPAELSTAAYADQMSGAEAEIEAIVTENLGGTFLTASSAGSLR